MKLVRSSSLVLRPPILPSSPGGLACLLFISHYLSMLREQRGHRCSCFTYPNTNAIYPTNTLFTPRMDRHGVPLCMPGSASVRTATWQRLHWAIFFLLSAVFSKTHLHIQILYTKTVRSSLQQNSLTYYTQTQYGTTHARELLHCR